jgi:hypothetical protein
VRVCEGWCRSTGLFYRTTTDGGAGGGAGAGERGRGGGRTYRAALVASCLRGALPPVDLRAVCLVRAMFV